MRGQADLESLEVIVDRIALGDSTVISIDDLVLNKPRYQVFNKGRQKNDEVVTNSEPEKEGEGEGSPTVIVDNLSIIDGYFTDGSNHPVSDVDVALMKSRFTDLQDWQTTITDISYTRNNERLHHASVQILEQQDDDLFVEGALVNFNEGRVSFDAVITNANSWNSLEAVVAELNLNPSKIRLRDLYTVVPNLQKTFGNDPISYEVVQVEGYYNIDKGNINAQSTRIWLGKNQYFKGSFEFDVEEEFNSSLLTAFVEDLHVDIPTLQASTSAFSIPKEIERLGVVDFTGSFDGFLNDFVAAGELASNLGDAYVDLQFDLSGDEGESVAYQGSLQLDSFNLAGMTLNPDLGFVTARVDITEGIGPNLSDSEANLNAVVSSMYFKDYEYENAVYKGKLANRVINGTFEISDEDVDFNFRGIVDVSNEVPLFDFNIIVNKANLCALNITTFPCEVSLASDVSFKGKSLDQLVGRGSIGDITLTKDSLELYIENIDIISSRSSGKANFKLNSDFVDVDVEGVFDLTKITNDIVYTILENTSIHNETWKVKQPEKSDQLHDYDFSVVIKNATPVFSFLQQDIYQPDTALLSGSYDSNQATFKLNGKIPKIGLSNDTISDVTISLDSRKDIADLLVNTGELQYGGIHLENSTIATNFFKDVVEWSIYGKDSDFDLVTLAGRSTAQSEGYYTEFVDHNIILDSVQWRILPNDGFGIYPTSIDIGGITFSDDNRFIKISDLRNKGLNFNLNDFDLSIINPIINYEPLYFEGDVNADFFINDIYNDRSIQGFLEVDQLLINQDSFGQLSIKTNRADSGVVELDLAITKDTQNLFVLGYADIEEEYLNFDVSIEDYPMNFFEYIIEDGISETEGTVDLSTKIYGSISDLQMLGSGKIKNAGTRIDYIGGFYRIEDQIVRLDESFIDFTGVQLIDEMGNIARIEGGLEHNVLADIRANLRITSDRFIGLNTSIEDNPLYYGLGVGELDISFQGPFDVIDIRMIATLGELSQLALPITSTDYRYEESFIVYDYDEKIIDSTNEESLREILKAEGVDFEMNLTFTPEASMNVIYDEETSNVLSGNGSGNIRLRAKRDGEFSVYGNFDVSSGRYLYTGYGAIAKAFIIKPGGTVEWTGDPINATLNVEASYPTIRAPLTELLAEYKNINSVLDAEIDQRQQVDLTLLIDGTLYNPIINFDIGFPNIIGQVRTYALSKIRALRNTENGINNQAVGLLVFRNFLPDNSLTALSGQNFGQAGSSTVTQFLTSQLSLMASEYLSSQLSDDGLITGIDFEIGLAQNTSFDLGQGGVVSGIFDVVPDEVQVNMSNRFRNDRLVLNVGGNYVTNSQIASIDDYLTGDFSLDWILTENRRLKLRFYSNFGFDEARATGRQRYGVGINYRKEFGSLTNKTFEMLLDDLVRDLQQETARENR